MKKAIFISGIFIILAFTSASAQHKSQQALFFEVGGAGLGVSINYEHIFIAQERTALSLRGGLGYFPMIINGTMAIGSQNVILGLIGTYSFSIHFIEAGISNTFVFSIDNVTQDKRYNDFSYMLVPNFGYRFQRGKMFYKLGYSPAVSFDGITALYKIICYNHFFYLGLGYRF